MNLVLIVVVASIKLVDGLFPKGIFTKCKKNDHALTMCLVHCVEAVRDILIKGIPKISLPRLDPYTMDKAQLENSLPGLKLKGEARNIVSKGLGKFDISKFDIHYDKNTADLTIKIPELEMTAEYTADKGSRLTLLKIQSVGTFTGKFVNIVCKIKLRGKIDDDTDISGKTYLSIPYVELKISFGRGTTYRIKPQESNLGAKVTYKLINVAPKRPVLAMLKRKINKFGAQNIKRYLNRLFREMPLEEVMYKL